MARLHKKFHFYLLKELLLLFFLSLSVFTFILVISRLGKMADLVINRGVDLKDILLLIAYSCPPFLTFTLPMAFLLSSVVALGRLSSENEILALKASGVNLRYLFVPISMLGVAVFFAGFLNNSLLLSKSSEAFRNILVNIAKKGISIEEGIFNEFPGVVIYIDKVDAATRACPASSSPTTGTRRAARPFTAEKGSVNVDLKTFDLSFMLKNGSLQRWQRQADTYRSLSFKNYAFYTQPREPPPQQGAEKKAVGNGHQGAAKGLSLQQSPKTGTSLPSRYTRNSACLFPSSPSCCSPFPSGIKRRTEGKFSGVVYSLLIFICYYILSAIMENIGKDVRGVAVSRLLRPEHHILRRRPLPRKPVEQRETGEGCSTGETPVGV